MSDRTMTCLLTIAEVSHILQVSKTTLYGKVRAGLIPAIRIRGLLRFNADDLQAWLDGQSTGPSISEGMNGKRRPELRHVLTDQELINER